MIRSTLIDCYSIDLNMLEARFALFKAELGARGAETATVKRLVGSKAPLCVAVKGRNLYVVVSRVMAPAWHLVVGPEFTPARFDRQDSALQLKLAMRLAASCDETAGTIWGVSCAGTVESRKKGSVLKVIEVDVKTTTEGHILSLAPRRMIDESLALAYYGEERIASAVRYTRADNDALMVAADGEWLDGLAPDHQRESLDFIDFDALTRGEEELFRSTRVGVLDWFCNKILSGCDWLSIQLAELEGETRLITGKEIDAQYRVIKDALEVRPLLVHDTTEDGLALKAINALAEVGVKAKLWASDGADLVPDLVIVHPAGYYEANGCPDVYGEIKERYPYSQMFHSAHLYEKDPGWFASVGISGSRRPTLKSMQTALLVAAKEAVVKRELACGKFSILTPPSGIDFICIDGPRERRRAAVLSTFDDGFSAKSVDPIDVPELIDYAFALPETAAPVHIISRREDGACWLIENTGATALVDFSALGDVVVQTAAAHNNTYSAHILSLVRDQIKNQPFVTGELDRLIATGLDYSGSELASIFNGKQKIFQSAFESVTGVRLTPSMKSEDATKTLLEGAVGIWVDNDGRHYCAGATSPVNKIPRACTLRQIIGSEAEPWLFELLEAFFIRHKDTTVLPYPFKHLREFLKVAGRAAAAEAEAQCESADISSVSY